MKHEKTFAAIGKLKDIELELHRLKNALEIANRALDAQRPWVGLEIEEVQDSYNSDYQAQTRAVEAKLKERNT